MTDTDGYNGWPNRETWAVDMHLSNDQGLYFGALELARDAYDPDDGDDADRAARWRLADMLRDRFDTWAQALIDEEPLTREIRMMLDEVGSRWRVDWEAAAESWLELLAEERAEVSP